MSAKKRGLLGALVGLALLAGSSIACVEGTGAAEAGGKRPAPAATSSAPVNGCVPGSEGPGWLCTKQGVPVRK